MMTTRISDALSCKFANMGFFFAMVVVFIHAPHHMTPSVTFMENVFPGFLKGSANAWFFLAAGFFFAGHVGVAKYAKIFLTRGGEDADR